jgi:hypothetical protein
MNGDSAQSKLHRHPADTPPEIVSATGQTSFKAIVKTHRTKRTHPVHACVCAEGDTVNTSTAIANHH